MQETKNKCKTGELKISRKNNSYCILCHYVMLLFYVYCIIMSATFYVADIIAKRY